jgi:hypothetical protein
MEASTSSFNIATFILIGMGVLVVMSLVSLSAYFFGVRSPLERNALGRMENALAPADVLRAHRQFRSQRLVFSLLSLFVLWVVLHNAAPEQTEQATDSFVEAVSIALRAAGVSARFLAEELGVINGCECSDPARIGGNGS